MSLTSCSRHPESPARGLCGRCGDFLCDQCRAESPAGFCAECTRRGVEAPLSRKAPLSLVAATIFALLSGGFLLALSGLHIYFAGASASIVAYWNGFIGAIYFIVAYGLVTRSKSAYNWSLGTQQLNTFLGAYNLLTTASKNDSTLLLTLSALSLAFHVGGWFSTWLSRSYFEGRA